MKKDNFFKKRIVTGAFSIIALTAGFSFMDMGITGKVVAGNASYMHPVSLIGMILILCSIFLAIYTVKKK